MRVTLDPEFVIDQSMIQGLDEGQPTMFSSFNAKMKAFNRAFKSERGIDAGGYYVFLINGTGSSRAGIMPFKRKFGYIFMENAGDLATTIAHELGHGAFRFQHTFEQFPSTANQTTRNLMSYESGNPSELKKYQWDYVRNQETMISWLQDADESALGSQPPVYNDAEYINKVLQQIRCAYLDGVAQLSDFQHTGNYQAAIPDYESIHLNVSDSPMEVGRVQYQETNENRMVLGAPVPYTTFTLNFGGVVITAGTGDASQKTVITANLNRLQDYLFPADRNAAKADYDNVLTQILGKATWADEDIEAIRSIANCGAQYFSTLHKYQMIKKIAFQQGLSETYEDLILDVIENKRADLALKVYANEFLGYLKNDPGLLSKLFYGIGNVQFYFGNENNFDRFLQITYALWSASDLSNRNSYTYRDYVLSGPASPYAIAYDGSYFFPQIEYSLGTVTDKINIVTTVSTPNGDQSGLLEYAFFQPVYFLKEEENTLTSPATDIPAIMVAGIVKESSYDEAFTAASITMDVGLTLSGVGNLTKLRHIRTVANATRAVVGGVEIASNTLDLLLNYTDLCVDTEFCNKLRQYNFYLQIALFSGDAMSSLYKSQFATLKTNAATEYANSRSKLVSEFGEDGDEIRMLDEHFGFTRHPNWVEVTDIRAKILAKKPHVLEIEGLDKTRNYNGVTLEGFTGCHSQQALADYVAVHGGSFRINGKPPSILPDEVFAGQPIVSINGKDYVKTNGQIVEYAPGKFGGTSTFFPVNWDNARILDEVEHAIMNNRGKIPSNPNGNEYFGFSRDGDVEIHFYLDTNNSINSYFPKKN